MKFVHLPVENSTKQRLNQSMIESLQRNSQSLTKLMLEVTVNNANEGQH
ncbi:hypothetical protein OH492_25425 [Vibrio chagasii]|nr:hypothetical protein [Vibrio chagasii]